jgi:hypothetical protein
MNMVSCQAKDSSVMGKVHFSVNMPFLFVHDCYYTACIQVDMPIRGGIARLREVIGSP